MIIFIDYLGNKIDEEAFSHPKTLHKYSSINFKLDHEFFPHFKKKMKNKL